MPKYNVQMEETAIYALTIEVTDTNIKEADGDLEQAISDVSERNFSDRLDITECLESIPNREVTWYEESRA